MFSPLQSELFDAERRLMLTVRSASTADLLAEIPGEFFVWDEVLAARIGISPAPQEAADARSLEVSALDEDSALRLWRLPKAGREGLDVFAAPIDALPDTGDAPDWGLSSAGWLLGDAEALLGWATNAYGDEAELFSSLSRFLSIDVLKPHSAVHLVDRESGRTLQIWPVWNENPLRALSLAAAAYPEVRYEESDFEFRLSAE